MAPESHELFDLARRYLDRQGWFLQATSTEADHPLELVAVQILREELPGLARLLVGRGEQHFQLLVGWRRATDVAGVLRGEEGALLGSAHDGAASVIVYDALADDELCRVILELATNGAEHAERVRPVSSLVSHASLVFDERLFMKCYRVLEPGPRLEVEVLFGLDEVGFNALLAPVGRWREGEVDCALVREFLPSALEGRLLALTSLRDLLAHATVGEEAAFNALGEIVDPERAAAAAGGDFAAEMTRLGQTTARMHLAMAEAFGTMPVDRSALVQELEMVAATEPSDSSAESLVSITGARLASLADLSGMPEDALGRAIHLHGDYHLRRVMRSETGWLVAGFADDPLFAASRPEPTRALPEGSVLEDLADMSFALGQVVSEALEQRPTSERGLAGELASAWRKRNRAAFVSAYVEFAGIEALLPADGDLRDVLLAGLEAARERRYEATSAEE